MSRSGRRKWIARAAAAVCLAAVAVSSLSAAPPTAQQRAQAKAAEAALKKAGNLYRAKKFAEAGEAASQARESLDQLAGDDSRELAAVTSSLDKQLAKIRDLLQSQGIEIAAGKSPASQKEKNQGISFTKQVASILVARCSGCHIRRAQGGLSMTSYAALSKGSKEGAVILPGDAKGSRVIELVEGGDMPRGGGKVTAEELALLTAWINAGARFDGPDPAAPLTSFASASKSSDDSSTKLKVVAATGREPVQFARDVGPILLAACVECHGERNPRNNFSVTTFEALLRGGDSGLALAPGKPDESLLVKKLRGTAGKRMPLDRSPLAEEAIAPIEKWISLGARFDGSDPSLTLEQIVDVSIAERFTHEELSRWRTELAAKNWRLILPDAKPNHQETADVLVYGTASERVLADVARTAEDQVARIRKLFKVPAEQPLIKGRLTLYVFERRYDYGEVGTMLEHRELPSAWRGHWHCHPVDTYACVLASDGKVPSGLVAQQIAGAYVASLGKIPHWFAEGTARAVAARLDPKDPRVRNWDDQTARVWQSTDKPAGFLTGSLQPDDGDALSFGFVKSLMTPPTRHASLIAALQQGTPFEAAFAKVYGGSPSQIAANWSPRPAKRGR